MLSCPALLGSEALSMEIEVVSMSHVWGMRVMAAAWAGTHRGVPTRMPLRCVWSSDPSMALRPKSQTCRPMAWQIVYFRLILARVAHFRGATDLTTVSDKQGIHPMGHITHFSHTFVREVRPADKQHIVWLEVTCTQGGVQGYLKG